MTNGALQTITVSVIGNTCYLEGTEDNPLPFQAGNTARGGWFSTDRDVAKAIAERLQLVQPELPCQGHVGDLQLPPIHLQVHGDVFEADGEEPYPWSIHAEAEDATQARTMILVAGNIVADVTIHRQHAETLPESVQAVSAALIWSALRAVHRDREGHNEVG